jgi:hypothetical protein
MGAQKLGILWADAQPLASQGRMFYQIGYCNTIMQWPLEHTVGGKLRFFFFFFF